MKTLASFCTLFILLYVVTPSFSQELVWDGNAALLGMFSSEESLPFWMHTNTETTVGKNSNFSALAQVDARYSLSENSFLTGRASFFYRDGVPQEAQRKEVFVRFTNQWLKVSVGAFSTVNAAEDLSISHKNFLLSGNARPMPGFLLEASQPLRISNTFLLDWGIGHYFLNDDHRFVDDVWVHYKRLAVHVVFSENHLLKMQLQHYAQWAGTSQVYGDLKDDFGAFVDVFTARETTETGVEGEISNATGNHMGSYLLDYYGKASVGTFNFYHEHFFEDGSGSRLANFPDGIWGIGFAPRSQKVFTKVMYEYIHTSNQSGNEGQSGFDDYFRNTVYRTGWSYEGNIIGLPLIINDPGIVVTANNSPIVSNRVKAHHFGMEGAYKNLNWQIKSTFVKNFGTYVNPFPEPLDSWYNYFTASYATQKYGSFRFICGVDVHEAMENTYGLGAGYYYSF